MHFYILSTAETFITFNNLGTEIHIAQYTIISLFSRMFYLLQSRGNGEKNKHSSFENRNVELSSRWYFSLWPMNAIVDMTQHKYDRSIY